MTKTTTEIRKKYGHVGPYLLMTPKSFAVFGNESNDDIAVLGNNNNANIKFLVDGNVAEINKTALLALSKTIDTLTATSAFATVLLTSNAMSLIKETVKKLDATHIRIYNIGSLVRFSIFDYRKFISNSLIQRAITQKVRYYDTDNANIGSNFTCTILTNSFLKLPNQNMNIRVGTNGICQFEPIKEDVKYLLRDQEVIEPVTTFFSDRLECQISLSLDPKS